MDSLSAAPDAWLALRRFTAARIATGRAGGSLPTAEVLRFSLDHAVARDAVHAELDIHALRAALTPLGLPTVAAQTCAADRLTYVRRPDLGRRLAPESRAALERLAREMPAAPDVVIILADGLSAWATQQHGAGVLLELVPRLRRAPVGVGALVLARQARVALQDEAGQILGARSSVILIGERPGLAAADSLGAYLVFNPRLGNTDADRNCVSNIRPAGLPLLAAAETLEYLITQSLRRHLSGTALKDERLPGTLGVAPFENGSSVALAE